MGTTADKLNYLNNTKGKLKTVINLMGTEIEDSDTFRSYTDKLQEQILKVIDGEVDLYDEYPKTTTTGTTASIQNTINNKMRIELDSAELTQPTFILPYSTISPDNPQDIRVVTGNNSVKVVGKNLFDKNNLNYIAGYLTVNGNKIESSSKTDTYYIECNPNTTYTLQREKVKTSGQVFRFASYSEVPTYNNQFTVIVGGLIDDLTLTITTGANAKYLAFSMGNVLHTDTEYIDKVQIEQGSSATTYEPYHNQTYPINLGTIELCKIGNYADQFFKNTTDSPYYDNTLIENEWYLKKNIGKIVLDGNESNVSVKNPGTSNWFYSFKDLNQNTPGEGDGYVLSNYYEANTIYTSNTNEGICVTRTSKEIRIRYGQEDTLSNFLNWVSNHNIEVYYVLATATYIYISQEDYPILKQELDNLYNNAKSYNGTTNITQTNDDLPFNLKIETLNDVEV